MAYEINRRTMMGVAAYALGVAVPAAVGRAASPNSRKFTMALSCGAVGVQASAREAIELAHKFGFEAVEPNADFLGRLSEEARVGLLAEMKSLKLVWASAGLPVDFRGSDEAFRDGMKRLPSFAETLQRCGVTRVGTWLNPSHGSLTYLVNFRQHVRRLGEVAKVLGDRAVRLGLEYVGPKTSWASKRFPFVHTLAETKELIAEIGRPNVGLMLDSWHWYTAEESRADLLTLRNQDVVCCHLNDAPKGVAVDAQIDSRRDLPAATGVIDLKSYLGALVEIGYDGPIMAEPFRSDLGRMPRGDALALVSAAMKKAFALVD